MRHIKLTDGVVYTAIRCGALNNQLFLAVETDQDWIAIIDEFSSPEKTAVIEHWYDGTETDHVKFEGFTALVQIVAIDGGYNIMLEKE